MCAHYISIGAILTTAFLCLGLSSIAGEQAVDTEGSISEQLRGMRKLSDDERATTTKDLALRIRKLPASAGKIGLASSLTNLATEGDFGRDTLQELTTTLAEALRQSPDKAVERAYVALAKLVRYEHMKTDCDAKQYMAAMATLEANDALRANADFTLEDLDGKSWTLKGLKGKVVVVNFWATWCPPCVKEQPDLEALHKQFKDQGLVILSITSEDSAMVKQFIADRKYTFPVLLDPGSKVSGQFKVGGIPKSYVYDRTGKLVSQAMDMRTKGQFLEMLTAAGLK